MSLARGRRALLIASIAVLTAALPTLAQDASTAPSESAAPAASEAAPSASVPPGVSPYSGAEPGSGEGLKIGYISLGDSIPFVNLVATTVGAAFMAQRFHRLAPIPERTPGPDRRHRIR